MKLNKGNKKKLAMKIFSLFLAVVAWFYIHTILSGGPTAYKDLKGVEVKLMGEPLFLGKNVFTVEVDRSSVDLRVKGPAQEVEKLTRMDIIAYINISGLRSGREYSPVVNFILPQNIEVVGAPPLIRVEIKDKNI
ncbi:MAG: CdaR family protein [Candidatus Omnitrophota bacterium]